MPDTQPKGAPSGKSSPYDDTVSLGFIAQQLMEIQRAVGRLEGSVEGLKNDVEGLKDELRDGRTNEAGTADRLRKLELRAAWFAGAIAVLVVLAEFGDPLFRLVRASAAAG